MKRVAFTEQFGRTWLMAPHQGVLGDFRGRYRRCQSTAISRDCFWGRSETKSISHPQSIVSRSRSCYLAGVSSFEREMSAAVKDVERSVFLELIRSHPEMTLAELSKLSKGQFAGLLSSVTVGEVIRAGLELQRGGMGSGALSPFQASGDGSIDDDDDGDGEEVNTRTAVGRREYDARVLEFIQDSEEPVSATEIRSAIGGTSLQVRKAVARLIENEKVTWQGKARGTRYSALS